MKKDAGTYFNIFTVITVIFLFLTFDYTYTDPLIFSYLFIYNVLFSSRFFAAPISLFFHGWLSSKKTFNFKAQT